MMLHLGPVNLSRPVPAELIQGFDHWKASLSNAVLGSAVAPPVGFPFNELAEILDVGARFGGGLLGQVLIVLGDKGELQVLEVLLKLIGCQV
jgi:hypothetical protein